MTTVVLSSNTAWSLFNFRGGIIRAILARGFRVIALAPEDSFSSKLAKMGCDVMDIRMNNTGTNPLSDLRTLLAYYSVYRRIKPDIILHFTIKPVIYGSISARQLGIPCVNMITGLGSVFIRDTWVTRLVQILYRFALGRSQKTIFQNPDDLRLFVDRGLVPQMRALRFPGSGIDVSAFSAQPAIGRDYQVFILIARMLWDKGVGVYVDAARELKMRHPKATFHLLGSIDEMKETGIKREQIEKWVGEGVVEYLGEADDVRPHIAGSDCVVLPSYYREGVPRSLLEAAAMSRPVITTDSVGCREAVDDGVTGYLCKVKDSVDLADKMERIMTLSGEQRAEMGRNGRLKMEREFDEQIVIRRYLEIIDEIIVKGRA